jgi:FixJ family two-component response regulator
MTNTQSRQEQSVLEGHAVIAIVDDEVSMLRALRRLLRSAGLTTLTYTSAEEFLQSGVQPRIGCLVLDVQLPGMTGLDLLARLAASGVTLPVVMITARAEEQTRLRAEQAGVVAYLRKPFEEGVFLEAIQRALTSGSEHEP